MLNGFFGVKYREPGGEPPGDSFDEGSCKVSQLMYSPSEEAGDLGGEGSGDADLVGGGVASAGCSGYS